MTDPSPSIVYLNGNYLPLEEACVPVLDRGFIFGDGVYEVIPVYAGKPFRLAHHLQRLQNSMAAVRIDNPHSDAEWQQLIETVIERNDGGDQSIYLQVTRGVAARDHRFPGSTTPSVFIMSNLFTPVPAEQLQNGVSAITLDDIRWQYCHIKSIALLPNILLRQQAVEQGAAEAILIRAGDVTEGAASNVFIVSEGVIVTPPKDDCLLPGITRDLVVELATQHGLPYREAVIKKSDLQSASEIWVTSSTKEILPVTRIDGKTVGTGKPGPVWQHMHRLYQDYKQALRSGTTA
ncbi:MAG: D-amino-acid transaminase [Proteobacteria bacterium]|jgi:D-alanine transaminase|nr:D-amino-acid transaminase [Pseudomonadota bacterium]